MGQVVVTGFTSAANNETSAIIVRATDDTILLAPSADLVDEAAGDSVTIAGKLGISKLGLGRVLNPQAFRQR